jgi:predicted transcriptional regulator
MPDRAHLSALAAEIVSAHVSHNGVSTDQLPALIQQVFNTRATVQ